MSVPKPVPELSMPFAYSSTAFAVDLYYNEFPAPWALFGYLPQCSLMEEGLPGASIKRLEAEMGTCSMSALAISHSLNGKIGKAKRVTRTEFYDTKIGPREQQFQRS
jgi:hypothetical protein